MAYNPHQLWPHQVEAVAATANMQERGQIIMACGSGKTLVALRAAEQIVPAGGLTVVLAPTLSLVAQILTVWRENAVEPFAALAACSDDTTVDAPVHLADLAGFVDVTTDAGRIGAWLTNTRGRRVVVGTYLSALRIGEALRATSAAADLLVCDEAHHLAGRDDFVTSRVLRDEAFPARRRLFFTATPRVDAGLRDEREGVLSMDDPEMFGPVLYEYSFARAIAEGRLEDYRVAVIGIPDREARRLLADVNALYIDQAGRGIDLRGAVAQAALAKAVRRYGLRRVVTFHPRVDDAREFTRTLAATVGRLPEDQRPTGRLVASHVDGTMNSRVRRTVLVQLADPPDDGWVSVANVRVLGEGVDVPAIDAIAFAHAKTSSVDIVQAVGRALRRTPDGSGVATIIVPIVVPDSDGEIGDVDAREYETLWRVVRALRAHDETLGIELDMQRAHGTTRAPSLPNRFTVLLADGTSDRILADLAVLLVRQTTSVWWEGYGHARDYQVEHGHLLPTADYRTPGGYPLGRWIAARRHERRKGWLPAGRVDALDKLGMAWDPMDAAWMRRYAEAETFYATHGHLRVTPTINHGLHGWLADQRRYNAKGTLSAERVQALDQIGMAWGTSPITWQTGYAACLTYHAEHQKLDAPKGYITHDGFHLGDWLGSRRVERRKGTLAEDRIAALDALGMVWDKDTRKTSWETGYAAARAFHAEHGHLVVPHAYKTADGFRLGAWVLHQRQLRSGVKPGGIDAVKIAALDDLGMVWGSTRKLRLQSRTAQILPDEV